MNAAVGLADLVRMLGALPAADHVACAALLGLERGPTRRDPDGPRTAAPAMVASEVTPPPTLDSSPGAPVAFWRLEQASEQAAAVAPAPPSRAPLSAADLESPGATLIPTIAPAALAPWPSLWPRLQAAVERVTPGREPDVPVLLRTWARGAYAARIPRVLRRTWPASIEVWIDRSRRLTPFWADQEDVLACLERLRGPSAVAFRCLDPGTQEALAARRGHFADGGLDPDAAILVLGDLGAYGTDLHRTRWLRTARELERRGAALAALVPAPRSRWGAAVARAWSARPWERARRGVLRGTARDRAAALLRLVAQTGLAQPGLVRALRRLLPADRADASTEADVWNHRDVLAADAAGLVLTVDASARWRAAFTREVDRDRQRAVRDVMDVWHGAMPRELRHAETLAWIAWNPDSTPPGDRRDAVDFAARLEATVCGPGGGPAGRVAALCAYGRHLLGALPDGIYERLPALKKVWGAAFRGVAGARWPSTIRPDEIAIGEMPPGEQHWAIHQRGDALIVTSRDDGRWPVAGERGSPVATIAARSSELRVAREGEAGGTRHTLTPDLAIRLRDRESVTLETDRGSVTLGVWERPAWAVAAGRDRYGLWAAFAIGGVLQRLRWIPPGTFLMGSPETEKGRYGDEGPQHAVTIPQGYWLGETPVTQALWQVVTGKNPSRFQTPERPVEQVSWDACRTFVDAVNARLDGLAVRLPTEAEWERACRAGTTAATWAGDLTLVGENHAPELAAIAWYGGNSGVEPGLDGAADSSKWPEKQEPHTRAGSQPVGVKHANPYGLRDMLGNVFEWCDDTMRDYGAAPVRDPRGEEQQGSDRVIRGGSWYSFARFARAAYRDASPPGFANDGLGFRLAGDQESAPGQAGRAPRSGAPEPRSGAPEPRSGDPGRGAAPAAGRDAPPPPHPGPRGRGSRG